MRKNKEEDGKGGKRYVAIPLDDEDEGEGYAIG